MSSGGITCEIEGRLPSLNEYIDACRKNRYEGAKMKRQSEQLIWLYIRWLPEFKEPVTIHFHWVEENKKRDPDNVAAGKKFVLDALVESGKLKDDGPKYVKGFVDTFEYGKTSKVVLTIREEKQ